MAEENSNPDQTPKAKRRGPNKAREKEPKSQHTVRIDANVARLVLSYIKRDNMRLTEAMERGLWLWLKEQPLTEEMQIPDDFVWDSLPEDMRQATMELYAYMTHHPAESAYTPIFRRFFEDVLACFAQTPAYQAARKKLYTLPAKSGTTEQPLTMDRKE